MDNLQIKSILNRYHLKPNFTFGQNFLVDEGVLESIVKAADLKKGEMVLEIGPGIGNLTEKLLEKGAKVLSVEKDPKFFPVLKSIKKNFPQNFRYEIADILEFDFVEKLGMSYKVVANIPYYITGKILKTLLNAKIKPQSIILLAQKEVAQNIVAKAGDLSVLAISVQIFGEPKIICSVPAKSFYPAPKVDSAVLKIDLHQKPKFTISNEENLFRVIKSCFAGKRKQIHNTLMNNLHLEKAQALKILAGLKINPAARPQELSIEQWIALANKISNF